MPVEDLIVNGTFDSGSVGWSGTDVEANNTENAYLGNGSSNRVAEIDGRAGPVTVMEQTFTVDTATSSTLTLDTALRTAASADEGTDGFSVEILDSGGGVIATTTVFPTTGVYSSVSLPVTFPSSGDYTIRFTEVGDNDSLGAIVDNISLLVCFANGTMIDTPAGAVPVEDLSIGDRVTTTDGPDTLLWIGRRQVSACELARTPNLRPVLITSGALGTDCPTDDLRVSRQHRMLTRGPLSARMFDAPEALVPAIKLTELPGISVDDSAGPITYFHLLFEAHRVVFANGAPSESLLLAPQTIRAMTPEAREELQLMFPDLTDARPRAFIPKTAQQKRYVTRLAKNGKNVLTAKG